MFHAGCLWGRSPGRRSVSDVDGGTSDLLDGIHGGGGSSHHACVERSFQRRGRREVALDFTRSELPFRLWMERALHCWVNLQNRTTGWVFQNRRGVRSKFGIYNHVFRTSLTEEGSCPLGSCRKLWRLETSAYGDPQGGGLS